MSVAARLGLYYFTYFTYVGVLAPYFPLWLAAQGYSAPQVALVMAMPSIARVFAPALWGWLADRTGWQRGIVVFAAFAVALGFSLLWLARDYREAAVVMLLLSVLAAGSMPLVEAAALAATRARAGSYGPVRVWGSIGFIVAVLGTGAWLDHHGPGSILGIIVGLSSLVCVAAFGIPARERHDHAPQAKLGPVLWRADVLGFFAACMCMSVAHGALYGFLSLHLEAAGYSKSAIGALWTLGVLAEIAVFFFLPQLMRHFTLRALLLASFACAAARFLAIAWVADVLAILVVAQLLHAATFGTFHAASIATVHRMFAGRLEARGQALYSSLCYGAGGAAGTLVAGWAWESSGASAAFTISALAGVAGAALIAGCLRNQPRTSTVD